MARRQLLTAGFWAQLMAPPSSDREVAMYCTLSPDEIEAIARKRTAAARLGYAVSLVYLRYPGRVRDVGEQPNDMMLAFLADQVDASTSDLVIYDRRPQTRREHIAQIVARFGYQTFTKSLVREFVHWLTPSAGEELRAEPLAIALIEELRRRRILIPVWVEGSRQRRNFDDRLIWLQPPRICRHAKSHGPMIGICARRPIQTPWPVWSIERPAETSLGLIVK